MSKDEPPLPPRATGIALGLWFVFFVILALVVMPALFAVCTPAGGGAGP